MWSEISTSYDRKSIKIVRLNYRKSFFGKVTQEMSPNDFRAVVEELFHSFVTAQQVSASPKYGHHSMKIPLTNL